MCRNLSLLPCLLSLVIFLIGCQEHELCGYLHKTHIVELNQQLIPNQKSPVCHVRLSVDYLEHTDSIGNLIMQQYLYQVLGNTLQLTSSPAIIDSTAQLLVEKHQQEIMPLYTRDITSNSSNKFPAWYNYDVSIHATLSQQHPEYMASVAKITKNTGSAHSVEVSYLSNYDLHNGKRMNKNGLFLPSSESDVAALLLHKLHDKTHTTSLEELHQKSYLLHTAMYVPANFMITANGIDFLFNANEIAPEEKGTITLSLSFDELSDYLLINKAN